MPAITLKSLLKPSASGGAALASLLKLFGASVCVFDPEGKPLFGTPAADAAAANGHVPVEFGGAQLGFVAGPAEAAQAAAQLLTHFAMRESEGRALAAEVLHLYRELHLIEQLSEQLVALLDPTAVAKSALAQAQRLISATHGSVLVLHKQDSSLEMAASFGGPAGTPDPLGRESRFAASILERGIGEVINGCSADPRASEDGCQLYALVCAPLRAGQRTVGTIALGNSQSDSSYSSGDLKLLNTIALQAAAAVENAFLCAEMVETARERAAYAAELQAASTVQQLLLQSASQLTPGFGVDSVYVPASEVGGDFFFVTPAPDGSIIAVIGDVSGKGLTAAMRVAMILGALRRETSNEPGEILAMLNNVLIAQGQLGFTTACCVRLAPTGEYTISNAGHIAPYVSGREINTPAALPLGLVADQGYLSIHGKIENSERIVLLSDGVLEARAPNGELYGFERLPELTLQSAQQIADTAKRFGQEDDITVLTLAFAPVEVAHA